MIDLTGVTHFQPLEEVVDVLCKRTQNTDREFFRVETAYFMAKMASNMRAVINTKDRGEIPVNLYVLALATSGYGKGYSVSVLENDIMQDFQRRFVEETFQTIADDHINQLAGKRAVRNSTDPAEEYTSLLAEFVSAGAFPFTFDSGTVPAVKQLRHKLLLANCGAINLQIDEIGANLIGSTELLTLGLELFDQGMVKQKLVKNTAENKRAEEVHGKTPTNKLLFGTPANLLNGGVVEDQFYSFLETGYARRCLFGYGQNNLRSYHSQSATEIYNNLINPQNSQVITKWSDHFFTLADPAYYGWNIDVADDVGIKLIEYKIACERFAETLPEHAEIRKAEISHRYFKALKLAGVYAFIDQSPDLTMNHLMQAILLVEESGRNFETILNREKPYEKLAKYICSAGTELTHADLLDALPYYKAGVGARNELINLATAYGYKRNMLIKKRFIDGIEFFSGETLKETDENKLILSHSNHMAFNYAREEAPFDKLHMLTQMKDHHWANHAFKNHHRHEDNAVPGFNMLVLDVDGGTPLSVAHELLKEYKFMTYTTKRHTEQEPRFRLIMPINYHLELDADDYKEFMDAIVEWLPFKVDEGANQRSRKWLTNDAGEYHYNTDGALFDVLPFIPKTSKNEIHRDTMRSLESLDNLERWFAQRMANGNRNNNMLKFALALVDSGMDISDVTTNVLSFNKKLSTPLPEAEINATVMRTVAQRYQHV